MNSLCSKLKSSLVISNTLTNVIAKRYYQSSSSSSYTLTSLFGSKSNNSNNGVIINNNNNNRHSNIDLTMVRTMIIAAPHDISLNNIRDNPGAVKKKVRVGRGIGSGRGKTSGRGHGGQKARAGHNIPRGFEGGQTPLFKRMRKYGFSNATFTRELSPINLGKLGRLIDQGQLDASQTITMKHLYDLNVVGNIKHGVKLLASGKDAFTHKIKIELSDFSEEARTTIEALGGEATNVYYDRVGLRFLLKPEKFDFTPKRARVPLKLREKYPNHPTGYLGAYSTNGPAGTEDVDGIHEEESSEEQQQQL